MGSRCDVSTLCVINSAVKQCCQCLLCPVTDQSCSCFSSRDVNSGDWLASEQDTVRRPQKTSSGALWNKSGCTASSHSRGPLPLSLLGTQQTERSQLCSPKQGYPDKVEIPSLFVVVGSGRFQPSLKNLTLHFIIQNIFSFVEEGLLIFQKREDNCFVIL